MEIQVNLPEPAGDEFGGGRLDRAARDFFSAASVASLLGCVSCASDRRIIDIPPWTSSAGYASVELTEFWFREKVLSA